jgi:hypothetical protein
MLGNESATGLRPAAIAVRGSRPYRSDGVHDATYRVLDERGGPLWNAVRATLERWFARLPLEAGQHLGAFWELYLHEALMRRQRHARPTRSSQHPR